MFMKSCVKESKYISISFQVSTYWFFASTSSIFRECILDAKEGTFTEVSLSGCRPEMVTSVGNVCKKR